MQEDLEEEKREEDEMKKNAKRKKKNWSPFSGWDDLKERQDMGGLPTHEAC